MRNIIALLILLVLLAACARQPLPEEPTIPSEEPGLVVTLTPVCKDIPSGWSCVFKDPEFDELVEKLRLEKGEEFFESPEGQKIAEAGEKLLEKGPGSEYEQLNAEFRQKCEREGGRWECYGWCLPMYEHFCDFPFDDAGKECLSSADCQGECVLEEWGDVNKFVDPAAGFSSDGVPCKIECKGTCATYRLSICDPHHEIAEVGIIKSYMVLCD